MEYVKIDIRVLTESWTRERKGPPWKYDSRFAAGIVTICCQQYTVKLLASSLTAQIVSAIKKYTFYFLIDDNERG